MSSSISKEFYPDNFDRSRFTSFGPLKPNCCVSPKGGAHSQLRRLTALPERSAINWNLGACSNQDDLSHLKRAYAGLITDLGHYRLSDPGANASSGRGPRSTSYRSR
ncbi:hypothetical protein BaRGS_00001886 [Batillaria attramentaria]|uniref:Uncharacterized protein n=1 Tax=Batillaria attramentaria TaxID=370345 RepID=A0ABD0M528_9CAEN